MSNLTIEQAQKLLNKHGICSDCGDLYDHHYDEPFASCECGTSEWHEFTPHMKTVKRAHGHQAKESEEIVYFFDAYDKGSRCLGRFEARTLWQVLTHWSENIMDIGFGRLNGEDVTYSELCRWQMITETKCSTLCPIKISDESFEYEITDDHTLIYVWDDDSWVFSDAYDSAPEEYAYKSDIYGSHWVPDAIFKLDNDVELWLKATGRVSSPASLCFGFLPDSGKRTPEYQDFIDRKTLCPSVEDAVAWASEYEPYTYDGCCY